MPYLTKDELLDIFSETTHRGGKFWERVADDVDWTVMGSGPGSGRWHNLKELRAETVERLVSCLDKPLDLKMTNLIIAGDNNEWTIMEMEARSVCKNGK